MYKEILSMLEHKYDDLMLLDTSKSAIDPNSNPQPTTPTSPAKQPNNPPITSQTFGTKDHPKVQGCSQTTGPAAGRDAI
jgi:hypothetical protein